MWRSGMVNDLISSTVDPAITRTGELNNLLLSSPLPLLGTLDGTPGDVFANDLTTWSFRGASSVLAIDFMLNMGAAR